MRFWTVAAAARWLYYPQSLPREEWRCPISSIGGSILTVARLCFISLAAEYEAMSPIDKELQANIEGRAGKNATERVFVFFMDGTLLYLRKFALA